MTRNSNTIKFACRVIASLLFLFQACHVNGFVTNFNRCSIKTINTYHSNLNIHRYLPNKKSFSILQAKSVDIDEKVIKNSPVIVNLNRLINRLSWISWWIQIILTVVSGVILSFANTVRVGSRLNSYQFLSSGFAFSAAGVVISLINSFATWNYTRLCRRISQGRLADNNARNLFLEYSKISVTISLLGMFVTLIGAEQIVGTLASKVLGQQLFVPVVASSATASTSLQALDIFLVQSNTNTLVGHFAPMLIYNFIKSQIPATIPELKQPPSTTTATKANE